MFSEHGILSRPKINLLGTDCVVSCYATHYFILKLLFTNFFNSPYALFVLSNKCCTTYLSGNLQTDLNINIPTKREMLSTIKIMKVLTLCLTNSLGDYEKVYLNKMDESGRTFVQR